MKPNMWLVLIMFAAVGGIALLSTTQLGDVLQGSSTLSLSQVQLTSSHPNLNGKVWVYSFTQGDLAQYVTGAVTAEQADQYYTAGIERPEEDFSMRVTYYDQEAIYPIKTEYLIAPDQIGKIYEVKWMCLDCRDDTVVVTGASKCTASGAYPMVSYKAGFNVYTYCMTPLTAAIGRIDNPYLNNRFTVTVSSQGQSASKTFNTKDRASGLVGDKVYIDWIGNLATGATWPTYTQHKTMFYNGAWRVISAQRYTSYIAAFDQFDTMGCGSVDECRAKMNGINDLGSQALTTYSIGTIENPASLDTGAIAVTLTESTSKPLITAYISADWIGIYTPIGRPDIIKTESGCFTSGDPGKILVTVKNIGEEYEIFRIYAQCPTPFTTFAAQEVGIQPGATKIVSLSLAGTTSSDATARCTVYADGTMFSDTASASVCVESPCACTAGDLRCNIDNSKVEKCSNDCSRWYTVESCEAGCKYDNSGMAYCAEWPSCPYECCVNDGQHQNKLCNEGETCENHKCVSSEIPPSCGDGIKDAGEECDDGNNKGGDGCSATCTIEQTSCELGCEAEYSIINPMRQVCKFRCYLQESITKALIYLGIFIAAAVLVVLIVAAAREVKK